MLGEPVLAATSGALHAAGKFGSAATIKSSFKIAGRAVTDLCREVVVLSRLPAMAATSLDIGHHLSSLPIGEALHQSIVPATMLVCYALWAKADLMLTSKDSPLLAPARYVARHLNSISS